VQAFLPPSMHCEAASQTETAKGSIGFPHSKRSGDVQMSTSQMSQMWTGRGQDCRGHVSCQM
jgi:hypothetical protein